MRVLRELVDAGGALRVEGRCLVAPMVRFHPPLAVPIEDCTATEYLQRLESFRLGLHAVLLIQAGACAQGLWRDEELLEHKAFKAYVVRGRGRAQPTHLKTRGKSRYGSRLRLQNHRRMLREINEIILSWEHQHGTFDRVFYSCPVRTWPELLQTDPKPPFEKGDPRLAKIPLDVHVPTFAELRRVRHLLCRGVVEREPGDCPADRAPDSG